MELYKNVDNNFKYFYPTPYISFDNKEKLIELLKDSNVIKVYGVPDGIDPKINYTLTKQNEKKRLYIMSHIRLNTEQLNTIHKLYGIKYYPIRNLYDFLNINSIQFKTSLISENFYTTLYDEQPSSVSQFVEYRFFSKRHFPATKFIQQNKEQINITNFVLPPNFASIIIIMPENFIQTTETSGYFYLQNNIIIRLYSKYRLTSNNKQADHNLITVINTKNKLLTNNLLDYFNKLKFLQITITEYQIIGQDNIFRAIIGNTSNLNF